MTTAKVIAELRYAKAFVRIVGQAWPMSVAEALWAIDYAIAELERQRAEIEETHARMDALTDITHRIAVSGSIPES
jgi:hypothetical protein